MEENTKELVNSLRYSSLGLQSHGICLWEESEPREFVFDGQTCLYRAWQGEESDGEFVALDTETVFIGERLNRGEVPRMVLASASGNEPDDNYIVHPRDLADFLEMCRTKELVFFNVAFDFRVMRRELQQQGKEEAVELLWDMVEDGNIHDLMLLDQLGRIAVGRSNFYQRSLKELVAVVLGVEIEKEESPRKYYRTVLDKDYRDVAPEFYDYAITDSRATLLAFDVVWDKALNHDRRLRASAEVDEQRAARWAPWTEGIQVRAALALTEIGAEGLGVDEERLNRLAKEAERELDSVVEAFEKDPTVVQFQEVEGCQLLRKDEDGELKYTEKGAPRKSHKAIRRLFSRLCDRHDEDYPRTPKEYVSLARDDYVGSETFEQEPALERYFRIQEVLSYLNKVRDLAEKVAQNADGDGRIHPRYVPLVKTGRATCHSPNIQNLPREGRVRECFVPRDGHIFYAVDYTSIELVALASICRHRYGYSKLGEKIEAGEDPHRFTASCILGKPADQVTDRERQAAKVYNFGVPGGMGARALAHQAEVLYGLAMSEGEAARWKQILIREVYPEIGEFLDDYLARFIADVMHVRADEVAGYLVARTGADSLGGNAEEWILGSIHRLLLSGEKRDGEPYSFFWSQKVWTALRDLYHEAHFGDHYHLKLEKHLILCESGPAVARAFFPTRAVTVTGRIWQDVDFRQAHNAQFQGLAADGAKIALYRLIRAGFKVVAFLHDEVIIELPLESNTQEVRKQVDDILVSGMREVIPDVPVRVEGQCMERWTKEIGESHQGREEAECDASTAEEDGLSVRRRQAIIKGTGVSETQ